MSKMEHRDTQQRVVIAVYRISCCKRGRELLLEEGAPESLIRLISKPNEEMRKVRYRCRYMLACRTHNDGTPVVRTSNKYPYGT